MSNLSRITSIIAENLNEQYDDHRIEQINDLVVAERAQLIKEINRKRGVEEWMKHTIKMPLTKEDYCFNIDCINLASKYTIPTPISDTNLTVTKLNGDAISRTDMSYINLDRYAPYTGKTIKYLIDGKRLYITNSRLLKTIVVKGVFEDYSEITKLVNKCTDCVNSSVFIKEDMIKDIYARVMQKLGRITPEYTQVVANERTNNTQ